MGESIYGPPPGDELKTKGASTLVWWVIAAMLSCPACGGAGYLWIRSETPYEAAVERATNDERVKTLLGEPVSADFTFEGKSTFKGDAAQGYVRVRLEGSERDGILDASGVRTGGVWGFSELRVSTSSGRGVDLLRRD